MMQSSPLNLRRAIIWIGRLVLGGIFIYAGYSKAFLPNHIEAFKMLPPWGVQFVAHTLPFAEIVLGLLVLVGWRLRIWASLLTLIMLGFFVVVLRAYLLHMDINCGCFATPEPIGPRKVLEDAALSALALLMTYLAFVEARKPHPWSAPQPAQPSGLR